MATSGENLVKIKVKDAEGKEFTALVTKEIVQLLESPDCCRETKITIYKSIIEASKTAETDESVQVAVTVGTDGPPPLPDLPAPAPLPDLPATAPLPDLPAPTVGAGDACPIHMWTEAEEKMLITLRSAKEDEFKANKQHDTLWNGIVSEMRAKNINVNRQQVINKWKNMKCRYKNIVDSNNKTGNELTKWKYYTEFSELYGQKASTRPSVTIDTLKKGGKITQKSDNEGTSSSSSSSTTDESIQKSCKKKRLSFPGNVNNKDKLIKAMENSNKEILNKLDEHHSDKMKRMDRMLDILEKRVNKN